MLGLDGLVSFVQRLGALTAALSFALWIGFWVLVAMGTSWRYHADTETLLAVGVLLLLLLVGALAVALPLLGWRRIARRDP